MTSAAGSGSSKRTNTIAAIVLLAILAVLSAFVGERLIASPLVLSVTMIAFMILLASIGDSFPGERERHTLETLLASALPDEALLLGKIGASVFYGWSATLVLLATLLIGANFVRFGAIYPPSTLLAAIVLTPLMLLFFSTAGVLLCLRAPTVRAAQPRLTAFFFGLFIPLVAVRPFIPREWREHAIAIMQSESGRLQSVATQIVLFAVIDLALLAVAVTRFRRSRLI